MRVSGTLWICLCLSCTGEMGALDAPAKGGEPESQEPRMQEPRMQIPRMAAPDDDKSPGNPSKIQASPETLAKRLSSLIWGGREPERIESLLGASPDFERVEETVDSILDDPNTRHGMRAFAKFYLPEEHLEPIPISEDTKKAFAEEGPDLFEYIAIEKDGTFADLLTSRYTVASPELAPYYGEAPNEKGLIDMGENRAGLFGTAGIIASVSGGNDRVWPPRRFGMLKRTLLCEAPLSINIRSAGPAPFDPGAEPVENIPIRSQLDSMTIEGDPPCFFCHTAINGFGYAYLPFDTFGRLDPEEPVAKGRIPVKGEAEGWETLYFDGQVDLLSQLSKRAVIEKCFISKWITYAIGEDFWRFDSSMEHIVSQEGVFGQSIRQIVRAVALSPAVLGPSENTK